MIRLIPFLMALLLSCDNDPQAQRMVACREACTDIHTGWIADNVNRFDHYNDRDGCVCHPSQTDGGR